MYQIQTFSDVVDREKRRRIVDVTFADEASSFQQSFSFSIDTTLDVIKSTVKSFLEDLNAELIPLSDLEPEPEPTPEAVDTVREGWNKDRARLSALMELVRDGVFTGQETQIATLQNKVKTGFKPEYLG